MLKCIRVALKATANTKPSDCKQNLNQTQSDQNQVTYGGRTGCASSQQSHRQEEEMGKDSWAPSSFIPGYT